MKNSSVKKTTLDNGLVVLSQTIDYVRSVSLGIWIRAGSRNETLEQNGLSHFIEHTVFKGTKERTSRQIALQADLLGGSLDAFTSQDITNYYIKVLDYHLPKAFDLLADIITNPTFNETELEKERSVILEEIKMVDDTPDELVYDLFASSFWPNHPLGRPIQGTAESVSSFSRNNVIDYYKKTYQPKNILIVATGNLTHELLVDLAHRYFAHLKAEPDILLETPPDINYEVTVHKKRSLEQTHIILGAKAPVILAPERYVSNILSHILGGGLSSRLFQTIREEHGLAYSVFSSIEAFRDTGCLSIYLAVSNEHVRKAIDYVLSEINNLKEIPVSEEELSATKEQIKTALLLSSDSISSCMNSLAQNEMFYSREITIDEIIQEINQVKAEEIQAIAQDIFQKDKLAITILGANDKTKLDLKL
ncbi:MAG: insulinase family protein [Acidobacteria bacterium]|nr:insulinase family protein [Acidobacteriota bacterium]